jgi:hypothetical protein
VFVDSAHTSGLKAKRLQVLAVLCGCGECRWLGGDAPEDHGSGLLNGFRAILARENPRNNIDVLDGQTLDESSARWKIADPPEVPRLAADIAAAVAPFLKMGEVLILVDPHVRPQEQRYSRSLRALFEMARRTDGSFPKRLELHIGLDPEDDAAPDLDWLVDKCERFLPIVLPVGVELKVKILTQRAGGKKLHNRYLLTDIGAVKVDPGLDEGDAGERFELIRLSDELYRALWDDYASQQPSFDCIREIDVIHRAAQNL